MSGVNKSEVDEGFAKPYSIENGGRVNAGFDKLNDGDASPTSVIKFHEGNKREQPEGVSSSAVDAEATKKSQVEPPKTIGLIELVSSFLYY